jgi:uncharacterized protein DUF4129
MITATAQSSGRIPLIGSTNPDPAIQPGLISHTLYNVAGPNLSAQARPSFLGIQGLCWVGYGSMNTYVKHTALLCLFAVLFALLLLAVSLSDFHPQQGTPIPGAVELGTPPQVTIPATSTAHDSFPLPGIFLGTLLIASLVYTLARLVGLVYVRKTLWLVLVVVSLIGIANILPRVAPGPPALGVQDAPPAASSSSGDYLTSPLGEAPSVFSWLAAGCLLLGAAGCTALLLKRPTGTAQAREGLAQSAEDALRDIAAGKDFSGVIVECYLRMSGVIHAERNIQRSREITAREFQDALEQQGLPPGPVHGLTVLFERARYGDEQMSQVDVDASQGYLRQVIQHCRAGRQG